MTKSTRSGGVQISWRPVRFTTRGAEGSAKFPIGTIVRIGREGDNDIVLNDGEISRNHARLVIGEFEVTLTDLNSANGSRIDGRRRLGVTAWRPGEQLQLGGYLLELTLLLTRSDLAKTETPLSPAKARRAGKDSDERSEIGSQLSAPPHKRDGAGDISSARATLAKGEQPEAGGSRANSASAASPAVEGSWLDQSDIKRKLDPISGPIAERGNERTTENTSNSTASIDPNPSSAVVSPELPESRDGRATTHNTATPLPMGELGTAVLAELIPIISGARSELEPLLKGKHATHRDASDQPPAPSAQTAVERVPEEGPAPRATENAFGDSRDKVPDKSDTLGELRGGTPAVADASISRQSLGDHERDVRSLNRIADTIPSQGRPGIAGLARPTEQRQRGLPRLIFASVTVIAVLCICTGVYWWNIRPHLDMRSTANTSPGALAAALPTQEPLLRIDPGMHTAAIESIGVDSACTLLATGSGDKTIRLWRLPEGTPHSTLRVPIDAANDGRIRAVAMAPDATWIAAGGKDHTDAKGNHNGVYIFQTNTGHLTARLGPFSSPINNLAISRDGRYLAAGLSSGGVRVWQKVGIVGRLKSTLQRLRRKTTDASRSRWQLIAEDNAYGRGETRDVAFDRKGTLFTVATDGRLRRYERPYTAEPNSMILRAGKWPSAIALQPSGSRIAVGFNDAQAIEVYDSTTFASLFSTAQISDRDGGFDAVAWSADGSRLYAGSYIKNASWIRIWDRAGEGTSRELASTRNTIRHLVPCGDVMVFGAADPAFGLITPNNNVRVLQESVQVDMRGKRADNLMVSEDGTRIRFGLQSRGWNPVLFDLKGEKLDDSPRAPLDLYPADTHGVEGVGNDGQSPKINGLLIGTNEFARAVAIAPGRQRLVLGSGSSLRAYDVPSQVPPARPGWHGISYRHLTDEEARKAGLKDPQGALITSILFASPAHEVGLKKNDVVVAIDDQKVTTVEDLRVRLSGYAQSDTVRITIRRGDVEQIKSVKLGGQPITEIAWKKPVPSTAWGVNISKGGKLVIACYSDGTIRWHRLSDGQELLALFVHAKDHRWVAWTPRGYYTASAGGEDLIGWHVNRSWTEVAHFFSAQHFRDRFYRPDIVQRVLQTLDEDQAIAEADRVGNTARQEKDITKLLPPVLEILSHKDGDAFSRPEVVLRYAATSAGGEKINDVDVYLDGSKVSSRGAASAKTRGFVPVLNNEGEATTLTLQLPRRSVKVTLVARSGEKASEPRSVQLTWTGATAEPRLKRRLLALLIGVSDYKLKSLKLDFAHSDALNLARALKAQEGMAFTTVVSNVLTNADSNAIRRGFDWLNANAQDGDLTVILLSGHGTTRNNTFYFLPAEADPANLSTTAISGHEIVGTIQGLPGGKLLLIDACRAGGGLTPVGMSPIPVDMNKLANDMGQPVGAVFFGSSGAGELSYEDSKLKAGVFTAALIEGLSGRTDSNGDGKIETDQMLVWLRKRIPELTDNKQHPVRHQSAPVEYTMSILR